MECAPIVVKEEETMILEKHKRNLNKRMNDLDSNWDSLKAGVYCAKPFEVIFQPRHSNSLIFVFKILIDDRWHYLAEKHDLNAEEEQQFYSIFDFVEDDKGISFRDILDFSGEMEIDEVEESGVLKSKIVSFFPLESVCFDDDLRNKYDDDEFDKWRG